VYLAGATELVVLVAAVSVVSVAVVGAPMAVESFVNVLKISVVVVDDCVPVWVPGTAVVV
jgi:hypothetical protein